MKTTHLDPLFKIKQIFGSVKKFTEAMDSIGSSKSDIISKITFENITKLKQYKTFAEDRRIDNLAADAIVQTLKDCYRHYLSTT